MEERMTTRTPGFAHIGILLMAALTPVFAFAATPEEALAPQIAAAEAVGASIYRHDRAASVATDALDEIAFRQDNRLAGWVTEEQGESIVVTFVGGEGRKPQLALYRAVVSRDGKAGEPQEFKPGRAIRCSFARRETEVRDSVHAAVQHRGARARQR
jgi:hypothetical protein